jgi:uncharacterized delta-60 repeat protein
MFLSGKVNGQKLGVFALTILLSLFSSTFVQNIQAETVEDGKWNQGNTSEAAFVDSEFSPVISGGSSQTVEAVVQPDGKILVAGDFKIINGVNKNSLARFNADGTLDTAFNTRSGANDAIFSIGLQSNGKIIISGLFTIYNGVPVGRIARLNADGSLDQTFNSVGVGFNGNSGANAEVSEIKVLPDDKILIGGTFTNYNGTAQNRLARLNANGSLDTSFTVGTGPNSTVGVIEIQADGKILIGGSFVNYNGTNSGRIARINPNGSLDTSFNTGSGAEQTVNSIVVQPDGKILVSGFFTLFNNVSKNGITRLRSDGSQDDTFNVAGFDAVVISIALQPDGKMIVGGSFTQIAGGMRQCIARLNADGTLDTTFNPGTGIGPQIIGKIALQSDGKAVVVGTFTVYNGTANGGVIRVNANGSLDTNLASSSAVVGNIQAMAVQSDGKIVIAGLFTSVNGTARANIARLNADGSHDTAFNPGTGANSSILSMAIQSDGKIIVGGNFTSFNGTTINRIVRLNSNGSIDTGFSVGTGMNSSLDAITIQSDGKILVGGAFTTYNGTTVNRFARLNTDGTLDTTFTTGTSSGGQVRSIVIQPDNKIVIGGGFTTYNGTTINRIARVNANGTLDTAFNPGTGAANTISSVSLQTDGKIVIGGLFTTVNGIARNRIARLNTDGMLDNGFDPGVGPGVGTATEVFRVLSVENGKTLIAGNFTTFNNLSKNRIARLNANGSLDYTFLNGIGALAPVGSFVRSMIRQPDGKILIGGQFSVFNVSARTGLVRFFNASDTFTDFDGDGRTDFGIIRRGGIIGPWTWWINESGSGRISSFNFGLSPNDIPQPGDFDGDGKDDIAMWRNSPQTGQVSSYYIILSSTNTLRIIPFGQINDVPLVEDYDGDGKDDLAVWRAPTAAQGAGQATWYYLGSLSNPNNNITYVPWGMRYGTQADQVDEPYPGDFDGDGKADFTIQRRVDITAASSNVPGVFYILTASGSVSYNYFGWASDRTLPGDYDGDGKTDIALARGFNVSPGNTTWNIRYSSGIPDSMTVFGSGFNFAQGDYDGDGKTDIGYFLIGTTNDTTGFWYIASRDGATNFFRWGARPAGGAGSGDLPISSYNNR